MDIKHTYSKRRKTFFRKCFEAGIFLCLFLALLLGILFLISFAVGKYEKMISAKGNGVATTAAKETSDFVLPTVLPTKVLLNDNYYVPQTFNNCGPAALSMDLSFYGVKVSQGELADALRPDHNATGKNDDKSTPPAEIAAQAEQYDGLIAYYRAAGNINLLRQFLAAGFPVMVQTLFMPTDPVAHYRVIIGYNDASSTITDEDGFQGPDVTYSYSDFMSLWKYYNYEYIVLTPPDKQAEVEAILGTDTNAAIAWQQAAQHAQLALQQNPADSTAQFDLSVADYYTGNYAQSVSAFEAVQSAIPPRTLWYQMEPIKSYYQLGDYAKVLSISNQIFSNDNPAYPELYVLDGDTYVKEGNTAMAKTQFLTALGYNPNLQSAKDALASLSTAQ